MKTLRLHAARDLRLHEEPSPSPGAGEALLRVSAVGLCGSDLHWFDEGGIGDATLARPLVLGHEFAGIVESGARAGERVAVDPAIPCGSCFLCLAGEQHLCTAMRFAGHGSTDGALRSLLAWPERLLYRLPESVSDVEGALLEPLGVALHALDRGRVQPGTTAGVFGCGPIGLMLVQLLHMVGATTLAATDRLPHRLAAAQAMGATETIEPDVATSSRLVDGLDVAFEAAGDDGAVEDAVAMLRPGGRLVLVGIPFGDRTSFTASTARRKELTIALCRRMRPADLPRAVRLVAAGRVELGPLVSERYALTDWRDAFDALVKRRGLKVVVEPNGGTDRAGAR